MELGCARSVSHSNNYTAAAGLRHKPHSALLPVHGQALSDAISITNRYFTSLLSMRS